MQLLGRQSLGLTSSSHSLNGLTDTVCFEQTVSKSSELLQSANVKLSQQHILYGVSSHLLQKDAGKSCIMIQ